MTFDKKLILTINSSIKECDNHLPRSRRSYGLIAEFFPMTEDILKKQIDRKNWNREILFVRNKTYE